MSGGRPPAAPALALALLRKSLVSRGERKGVSASPASACETAKLLTTKYLILLKAGRVAPRHLGGRGGETNG